MEDHATRVLIVDDEVFFREAIGEILADADFSTDVAVDGASALAKAADPTIGAVVLDVRLPDIDGIQVLAQLREMRPGLPVIMLSSSTDQEIVLEALRLGAGDYLAKPLHDEELVLAVGRALDRFEVSAARDRLSSRINRLVDGMDSLSRWVQLADPVDRVSVLRQGIVDAAGRVLQASRVSLMLADEDGQTLSVVASRGTQIASETMNARRRGDGAAGIAFEEGCVLCIPDVMKDDRFGDRSPGAYQRDAFAIVPLVCLGVPVGVLCISESEDDSDSFLEEANILRLLGMQVSEFLAADPAVEHLLQSASLMDVDATLPFRAESVDTDAELARVVCDAVATEVEPARMLERALSGVAGLLGAAPVSVYLLAPDAKSWVLEAAADGARAEDRERLPVDQGLTGGVVPSGHLIAVDDPASDARFDFDVDTAADGVTRGYMCVPLSLRSKPVGLLRVFFDSGGHASPRTAEILGAAFSAALRNVLLYRSLLKSIDEVAAGRRLAGE